MTMMPWSANAIVLLLLFTLPKAASLDVQIVNVTCDKTLPVTADVYLQCEGGGRCTFGESASVYGNFYYNGVANSGIENNAAYLSADLYLMGVSFNLCEMQAISLCDATMVADEANQNACPGDGSFKYDISYGLPSSGPEVASWLTTGWKGNGVLQLFATQDESKMIGNCYLNLKTSVTQKEKTLIGTPSASVSAFVALGILVALSLLFCYCHCCMRRRTTKPVSKKYDIDDLESHFTRMEEERSYWSGSKSKSKRTEESSSVHEPSVSLSRAVSDL